MKYSVSAAARIVGVTRKTFYNHIAEKSISHEKDEKGHLKFDGAELIRVYGDKVNFDRAITKQQKVDTTQNETPVSNSYAREIEDLKAELADLKTQIKVKDQEIDGKENLLEERKERIDKLENSLSKAQNITKLLEDQRTQADKTDDWKVMLEAQKENTVNAKKEAQRFKQSAIDQKSRKEEAVDKAKALQAENAKLKSLLEEEINKNLWDKIFG